MALGNYPNDHLVGLLNWGDGRRSRRIRGYVGQRIANCRDEVRLNKKPESQTKSTQPTNPQQNQDSWFHPQVNPRHVPKPKQVSPPASL